MADTGRRGRQIRKHLAAERAAAKRAAERAAGRHTAPDTGRRGEVRTAKFGLSYAARYVEHYLLSPDTNAVENAIRPFVLGRKGWLFCGSPRGAHAGAGIYSLIETAKGNGHEPYRYLCYVFDRLPGAKTPEDIDALLPYNLSPAAGTTPTG
ncbi:MAG: transposase domain-containing protein [Spirochaetaceae bacterium]|nr:transposase domain-containing protein [Spirochaetaceae bacterium]